MTVEKFKILLTYVLCMIFDQRLCVFKIEIKEAKKFEPEQTTVYEEKTNRK